MSETTDNPIADISAHIRMWSEAATKEWLEANATPEALKKLVHDKLDADKATIVQKLLGFSVDRWNDDKPIKWEVDHCNGRGGESAAGDYLRQVAKGAVQEWLRSLVANLPEPTDAAKAAAIADYQRVFRDSMRESIRQHAREQARKVVESYALVDLGQFLPSQDSDGDTQL